ncbi:unannotated protein [freshwater metagenome]|uniref:Unannotated protein n=1 Tax=freshwater metagenome TaxID=449393 RepID=A0A6J7PIH5_9ZZZZ
MPRLITSQSVALIIVANIVKLLSRIWPGLSSPPLITSSSPVESIATRSLGYVKTCRALIAANTPTPAGLITDPAANTTSPVFTSSPISRIASPICAGLLHRTRVSLITVASSIITIASAPCGTGAPVMIRAACPAPIA